jgi:hypothetical protein
VDLVLRASLEQGVRRGSEGGQEGVRRGSGGGQEGVKRGVDPVLKASLEHHNTNDM